MFGFELFEFELFQFGINDFSEQARTPVRQYPLDIPKEKQIGRKPFQNENDLSDAVRIVGFRN